MGIFDILGPVMVGPSSSHTAGAVRIGLLARQLLGVTPVEARIGLHGSMAATGDGHGTPLALLAGLLGFAPDDGRIPRADALAREAGLAYRFEAEDLGDVHPNSVHLSLFDGRRRIEVCASSVGGGRIDVWNLDGFATGLDGEFPTLLFVYEDRPGSVATVSAVLAQAGLNIAAMKVPPRLPGRPGPHGRPARRAAPHGGARVPAGPAQLRAGALHPRPGLRRLMP